MFFNPYAIGAMIGLCILCLIGGYYKGYEHREIQAKADLAEAYKHAAQIERDNTIHLNNIVSRYETQKRQAQKDINTFRDNVSNGYARVFINTNLPAADGVANNANAIDRKNRCELDAETAKTLIDIAADGDDAIRRLNALIDFYQGIKQ